MTDVKKFMFDANNFDAKKQEAVTYTEEQLALAKTQGQAAGKAEGLREAQQQTEARTAELLQKAFSQIEMLVKKEDRRETEKSIDTVKLAMRVIGKVLPAFAQKHALEEIERVIQLALEARRDEPRLAVTVAAGQLEALKERVDAAAAAQGFAGKVIVIADDMLAPTDCRVEWADGGAERLFERIVLQVETEFTKAIAAMGATLENK